MYVGLSMLVYIMFMMGFDFAKTSKFKMILMFFCGTCVSYSMGGMALQEFKSLWIGAAFAICPIFITIAWWWFTAKRKQKTMTTLFLIGLVLLGCDKTTLPEDGDVIVGVAKVEDLDRQYSLSGTHTSFRTHSENRVLVYLEREFAHVEQSASLKNEDEIRIVKRGQQYYWTTGGRLVPFD